MKTTETSAVAAIDLPLRLRVEFRRLTDTPAWVIMLVVLPFLGIGAILFMAFAVGIPLDSFALATIAAMVYSFGLMLIGIYVGSAEWRQRTALVTYTLDPKRSQVLLAKALVVLGYAVFLGLVAIGTALGSASSNGTPQPDLAAIVSQPAWIIAALIIYTLVGFGLGAAFQNVTIALVVGILGPQLLPNLLRISPKTGPLGDWIDWVMPLNVAMEAQSLEPVNTSQLLVALGLWLALPLAIGFWRNATKDVS